MYSEMRFSYIYFREFDPLYGNQMKNVGFGTSNYSKFWDDISWLSSQSTVASPPFNWWCTPDYTGDPAFLNHKELHYKVRNT